MAARGKKKRTEADEADSSLEPGLEQPLEEEKTENNIDRKETHKRYRKKVKCEFGRLLLEEKVYKAFCEEYGLGEAYQNFLEKCKKRTEESSKVMQEQTREFNEEVNSSSSGGHGGIGPMLGTPFEQAWELKRKREEELDKARRGKRPATADNHTPPCPPIYGSQPSLFMAGARCQTSPQSAASHLSSTSAWAPQWEERLRKLTGEPAPGGNNGAHAIVDYFVKLLLGSFTSHAIYLAKQYEELQVKDAERRKQEQDVLAAVSIDANPKFKEKKKEADDLKKQVEELQEEVSKLQADLGKRDEIISNDVFKQNLAAVSLGWNLMKSLLESRDAGTEFLNLSLLDTIKHCPPLLHQFNEGLTSISQGHTNIDGTFCIPFDPPVVVPCPFVSDQFTKTVNMGGELIGFGPPADPNVVSLAANSPPLQTAVTSGSWYP